MCGYGSNNGIVHVDTTSQLFTKPIMSPTHRPSKIAEQGEDDDSVEMCSHPLKAQQDPKDISVFSVIMTKVRPIEIMPIAAD